MSNNQHQQPKLLESLQFGDLRNLVSDVFTVDQYKSKMGEDRDIVVIGFKVKEKHPATDLMEFIEKGYDFILDADISAGEESDGKYQVFVEVERTPKLAEYLNQLFKGVGRLCDCKEWRFRYQKAPASVPFNEETVLEHIPLTPEDYESKILEIKGNDIKSVLDQGSVEVDLDEDNNLTFSKPYSGDITAKFISIGNYEDVKETLPGKLSLDESSQSQVLFLTKYLGKYDIDKIGDKFLIRNGERAIVIQKDRW